MMKVIVETDHGINNPMLWPGKGGPEVFPAISRKIPELERKLFGAQANGMQDEFVHAGSVPVVTIFPPAG